MTNENLPTFISLNQAKAVFNAVSTGDFFAVPFFTAMQRAIKIIGKNNYRFRDEVLALESVEQTTKIVTGELLFKPITMRDYRENDWLRLTENQRTIHGTEEALFGTAKLGEFVYKLGHILILKTQRLKCVVPATTRAREVMSRYYLNIHHCIMADGRAALIITGCWRGYDSSCNWFFNDEPLIGVIDSRLLPEDANSTLMFDAHLFVNIIYDILSMLSQSDRTGMDTLCEKMETFYQKLGEEVEKTYGDTIRNWFISDSLFVLPLALDTTPSKYNKDI